MIFKKKPGAEFVAEDRKLIQNNSDKVGKLAMLTNDDAVIAKLKDLQEKLKYLMPAKSQEAYNVDEKIANKIDDLKIEMSRFNDSISHKIDSNISEILLLLVNRND